MTTSIAILALFVIRLAVPIAALFIVGEWLSRVSSDSPFPRKNQRS